MFLVFLTGFGFFLEVPSFFLVNVVFLIYLILISGVLLMMKWCLMVHTSRYVLMGLLVLLMKKKMKKSVARK